MLFEKASYPVLGYITNVSMYIKPICILTLSLVLPLINAIIHRALKTRMSYLMLMDSISDLCMAIAFIMPIFLYNLSEQANIVTVFIISIVQLLFVINNIIFNISHLFENNIEDSAISHPKLIIRSVKLSLVISIINIMIAFGVEGHNPFIFISHVIIDVLSKIHIIYMISQNYNSHKLGLPNTNNQYLILDKIIAIAYTLIGVLGVGKDILLPCLHNILTLTQEKALPDFIAGVLSSTLFALLLVFIYISCAIPWSYVIVRAIFDIDITKVSWGNPGTTNVKRAIANAGYSSRIVSITTITCGVMDMLRAFIPVYIILDSRIIYIISEHSIASAPEIQALFTQINPQLILSILKLTKFFLYACAIAAGMCGNMWTPFLNFHGGLGASCMFGMIMALATSSFKSFLIALLIPISWFLFSQIIHKLQTKFLYTENEHIILKINLSLFGIRLKYIPLYRGVMVTMLAGMVAMIIMSVRAYCDHQRTVELFAAVFAFVCVILRHDLRKGFVDFDKLSEMNEHQKCIYVNQ